MALLFVVTQLFILIMARFMDNFLSTSNGLLYSSLNWVSLGLVASSSMTLLLVVFWHIVVVVFLLVMME